MRKILQSKAGVTVLEGVIALGLLAVVTAGSFGVLLASSRQSSPSDMREEMMFAVEQADHLLQVYAAWFPNLQSYMEVTDNDALVNALKAKSLPYFRSSGFMTANGPCDREVVAGTVLDVGEHTNALNCLLPLICDKANSNFSYTVESADTIRNGRLLSAVPLELSYAKNQTIPIHTITYQISCNGYQL
ncbi:MAG: hypothetical protein J6Y25_02390 [Elusimicrobiaceae bacterium]|nr:hypothetical protein [Elusimicrobiaceae bacterium]